MLRKSEESTRSTPVAMQRENKQVSEINIFTLKYSYSPSITTVLAKSPNIGSGLYAMRRESSYGQAK